MGGLLRPQPGGGTWVSLPQYISASLAEPDASQLPSLSGVSWLRKSSLIVLITALLTYLSTFHFLKKLETFFALCFSYSLCCCDYTFLNFIFISCVLKDKIIHVLNVPRSARSPNFILICFRIIFLIECVIAPDTVLTGLCVSSH